MNNSNDKLIPVSGVCRGHYQADDPGVKEGGGAAVGTVGISVLFPTISNVPV